MGTCKLMAIFTCIPLHLAFPSLPAVIVEGVVDVSLTDKKHDYWQLFRCVDVPQQEQKQ